MRERVRLAGKVPCSERECNHDARAAVFAVRCLRRSSVSARNSVDERQAKTVPIGVASFDPPLEYILKDRRIEPWSVIFQGQ